MRVCIIRSGESAACAIAAANRIRVKTFFIALLFWVVGRRS
jgi:hypothetical protein